VCIFKNIGPPTKLLLSVTVLQLKITMLKKKPCLCIFNIFQLLITYEEPCFLITLFHLTKYFLSILMEKKSLKTLACINKIKIRENLEKYLPLLVSDQNQ